MATHGFPKKIFIIAGEASGDKLAAELVAELKELFQEVSEPEILAAGGSHLAKVGAKIIVNLPKHAVVGLIEPLKKIGFFKKTLNQLVEATIDFKPDLIILVDYSGFNLRFSKKFLRTFNRYKSSENENKPKLIYFISPQVWASRPGRAKKIEKDFDLLLSIFPFEKDWYEKHAPNLDVEFIGHPLVDRFRKFRPEQKKLSPSLLSPKIILLPGSRVVEIKNHWPAILETVHKLNDSGIVYEITLALPNLELLSLVKELTPGFEDLEMHTVVGSLPECLNDADIAIASSGTVTMECAWFRIPTIVVYKTSWITYQIANKIITVPYIAMPNILANREIFPEFIQSDLTSKNLLNAVQAFVFSYSKRKNVVDELNVICESLGEPGPCTRAAQSIYKLMNSEK